MRIRITSQTRGRKITAVRAIRALTGLGLRDSKMIADSVDPEHPDFGRHPTEITVDEHAVFRMQDGVISRQHFADILADSGVGYEPVPAGVTEAGLVDLDCAIWAMRLVEDYGFEAAEDGLLKLMSKADPSTQIHEEMAATLHLVRLAAH